MVKQKTEVKPKTPSSDHEYVVGVGMLKAPVPILLTPKNRKQAQESHAQVMSFEEARLYLIKFYEDQAAALELMKEEDFTLSLKNNLELSEGGS